MLLHVVYIVIGRCVVIYIQDERLKLVVKGCKILLYLNVSHTNITDASLRTIAK